MDNLTPRSRRKAGLFSGAKAYFSGKGSSHHKRTSVPDLEGLETPQDFLSKTQSESALASPVTPRTRDKKSRKIKLQNGAETSLTPRSAGPRAKQKIRRASLRDPSPGNDNVSTSRSLEDAINWDVSSLGSSKKSTRRRQSLGVSDTASESIASRESTRGKKKHRHASDGAMITKEKSKRSSGTPKTPKRSPSDSVALLDILSPLPLDSPDGEGSKRKDRTTVDGNNKIRRSKKKDNDLSDGEGEKSRQSSSSKRSKGSKSSKKSVSKKAREKAEAKKKLASPRTRSSRSVNGSAHSKRSDRSLLSPGKSPKVRTEDSFTRRGENSSRRGGRRINADIGDPGLESKSQVSELSLGTSVTGNAVDFDELPDYTSEEPGDLASEVARLKKKIVELNEESLKAQFNSQSETAKLRKELREEKLELQRSQTDRRELRAELRDRDSLVDESDRKIQALEKAVESQLDKVDDLEEELRRANEEIFDMEQKLTDMEQVLADSSAVENKGLGKENDFGEKRLKRMERRLEDREREIAQREKRLQEERDALIQGSQPQRKTAKLEQDNRMLLKALNREKSEAVERMKEKEEEIIQLQKQVKKARMRSYSQLNPGSVDDNISKLLAEKVELQQQLDKESEEFSNELREKKDQITSLRKEVQRMNDQGDNLGSSMHSGGITGELDAAKAESDAMRSKFDAAQRRNQLLEDDIDHWKSVNCSLEDEVVELKSQLASWQSKYEEASDANSNENGDTLPPFNVDREPLVAHLAVHRRDDDDDSKTTGSIASLWSKLTSPTAKKPVVTNMDSVREVLARSTFH